jgi:hypothetical protein
MAVACSVSKLDAMMASNIAATTSSIQARETGCLFSRPRNFAPNHWPEKRTEWIIAA